MDVVTLLPAATEMVAALGITPVGVSHECDYPASVQGQPAVTTTRVDGSGSSEAIDEAVAEASDGEGVYDVRADRLERLDPDLIVTQGVCDVCAVDAVLVERVVADRGLDAEIVATDVHRLSDLYGDLRRLGSVLDRKEAVESVVTGLQQRVAAVEERVATVDDRPSVAVLDWLDPVMVAGHWVPELVELAGGEYPLAAPGERSRPRHWSAIREADPAVLVAAPCGFGLDQTLANRAEVEGRPGWDSLRAVRSGRAYAMDGHHYVNRPGPRLVDTLEHLASVLHPDLGADAPADVVRPLARDAPAQD